MQDHDFYDLMFQLWTKTTGAEDSYWKYEDTGIIESVDSDGWEESIAYSVRDNDAEFITAVHGCFGDLIRKLRDLEDENARLDERVDEMVFERIELIQEIEQLEDDLCWINDRLDF